MWPDARWYFTEFEAKDSEALRIKKDGKKTDDFYYILFLIIKRLFITRSYHIAKFLYCTRHLIEKRALKDIERHYRNLVVLQ